jgi:predicted nucleotidyltransferase
MPSSLPNVDELRRRFPQLRMLVMHGSRARGDAHEQSDWDFGYLASAGFDELGLRAALSAALATDAIDLADLDRAGGVLRYAAARDGQPLLEQSPGEFERFSLAAIRFWLDVEPIFRVSHAALLEQLG